MEIKYRPEIDGLRAIAVLSVIIYHAEFMIGGSQLLPGGFLGVDVFFVISGFLITSLMMKELHQTGTISISSFYERRARRLLPAFLVVILASLPFAWLYLLPEQIIDYAKSLISSLLFASNFYWNHTLQQYGAESSLLKPLLHTWSLAVEEQYYIIFPLIILAVSKWRKSKVIILLSLSIMLSLFLAEWLSYEKPSFSFYMLPSRAWELLAGAALAYFIRSQSVDKASYLFKIMPAIGVFLILYGLIFINLEEFKHPGFITLFPVAGTVLIIWFANKKEPIYKILSSRLFVGGGLVSYSLYLWHYPVLAFYRLEKQGGTPYGVFLCILFALILSLITYFYIEKPFRQKSRVARKPLLISIAVVTSTLISVSYVAIKHKGFPERFAEEQQLLMSGNSKEYSKYTRAGFNSKLSKRFNAKPTPKLLIIGDSFAQDVYNILNESGRLHNIDVITHYIPMPCHNVAYKLSGIDDMVSNEYKKQCDKIIRIGDRRLNARISSADGVIVSSRWVDYTAKEAPNLLNEIDLIDEKNTLFVGIKVFGSLAAIELLSSKNQKLHIVHKKVDPSISTINKKMHSSLGDRYLNLYDLVCNDRHMCPVMTPKGLLISYDGGHLTPKGAEYMGEKIGGEDNFARFWQKLIN
jgi:peptidoglycan/LPS O-acetylase OafA/YrhL